MGEAYQNAGVLSECCRRDIVCPGVISMAQIPVRDLPDDVKEKLRRNAEAHGRSLEAEVRDVLTREPDHKPDTEKMTSAELVDQLLAASKANPIPDDVWAEFEANLKRARKGARARPVRLDK
jgi:plasmid stability protein